MKSRIRPLTIALAVFAVLSVTPATSQQPTPASPAKRNFEAEIQKSLAGAKEAAQFDFQGTLVRTCLVPQSGGEDTDRTSVV